MNATSKKIDKKTINLVLTIGEIVLIAILLTISLIAMFTLESNTNPTNWFMEFIAFLQTQTIWFFILIVLPLIGFFLLNGYMLFKAIYADKVAKPSVTEVDKAAMIEEAKRQLREELMKEMQATKPEEENK
jgi:predicted membrane protein